ncbi:MAG: SHOCT domain-containing protein [Actinomycetes bacterium]
MTNELAAVSETIDLLPREVLDRAEAFLREQGYSVVHRMFTSLTTERTLPDSAGGQEKWTITILVLPEREGGLRLKVLGNDVDGVRQQQAHWVEWSESLPKRRPRERKSRDERKQSRHGSEEPPAAALKELVPAFNSRITPAHKTSKPSSTVAGGAEVLSNELRNVVQPYISEGESIQFCLLSRNIGRWNQAIVTLTDRLLMIMPEPMARATSGHPVISFYYRDITGIEVNTGLINGVIEINTPIYQGTRQKGFWKIKNEDGDPYKVVNCLPISKKHLKEYKPYVDRLRAMERAAKQERVISSPPWNESSLRSELESLASLRASGVLPELGQLASLRASGVLTEQEFQRAKGRL